MIFSRETLEVGGKISVPDGFVSADAGIIASKTPAGINVEYGIGPAKQKAFYAYTWLNMMYSDEVPQEDRSQNRVSCDRDDLNDEIPF